MSIFRSIFEDNLDATLGANGVIEFTHGGSTIPLVEALRSDREAYEEEYRAWLHDVWLQRHRAELKRILQFRGNGKRFADLCTAVKGARVVPMIGSGMSYASGFPLWRRFLHELRESTSVTEDDLNTMLDAGMYEEAVDILAADMGVPLFNEQIEHRLRVEDPGQISGPVRLLPELFSSIVLTTNLDDVLEHVYEACGKKLHYPLYGRHVEDYRRIHAGGSSCLLKLHGDCRTDHGRVLGVAEYDAAYAEGGAPREALSLIFRNWPVLWLGCSLTIDRTVSLADGLAHSDTHMPRHFAFLPQPADHTACIAREKELTAKQIFPIWYDGDHDSSIEALLVGLLDFQGRFATEQ